MPLTDKGQKIMANMVQQYGPEKAKRVFYASLNAGKINGVEPGRQQGGAVEPEPRRVWEGNTWPWQNIRSSTRSPRLPIPEWHVERPGKEPQVFNRRPDFAKGGLVDHEDDPDLPPVQDDVSLIDNLPLPKGYQDPAYIAVIQQLLEGQKRLNAMQPIERELLRRGLHPLQLRRYWLGGFVRRR